MKEVAQFFNSIQSPDYCRKRNNSKCGAINDANLADNALIIFDIDQVGSSAKAGLKLHYTDIGHDIMGVIIINSYVSGNPPLALSVSDPTIVNPIEITDAPSTTATTSAGFIISNATATWE